MSKKCAKRYKERPFPFKKSVSAQRFGRPNESVLKFNQSGRLSGVCLSSVGSPSYRCSRLGVSPPLAGIRDSSGTPRTQSFYTRVQTTWGFPPTGRQRLADYYPLLLYYYYYPLLLLLLPQKMTEPKDCGEPYAQE